MTKAEARLIMRERRASMNPKEVNVAQDMLLIRFQEMSLPYFQLVHTYLPIYEKKEPDPSPLLDWMRFSNPGLKVCYARIQASNYEMIHLIQDEHMQFEKNIYGIPEPNHGVKVSPSEIDLAFIPLLAFDLEGNRVGYGKGYYDRFLSKCREDIVKVGLSYFPHIDKIKDVDSYDKKLDFCITPESIYAF